MRRSKLNQNKYLLTINAGSSSIKFAVFEFSTSLKKYLSGQVTQIKTNPSLKIFDANDTLIQEKTFSKDLDYDDYFHQLISALESPKFKGEIVAVGHRVVHGGSQYKKPVLINRKIIKDLKKLNPFAPLHQPYNIQAIEHILKSHPNWPQVACFDTAFHSTHPPIADLFGIPRKFSDAGIKRYGFHGLSYEYITHKMREIDLKRAKSRMIVAHLGNGASMCAIHHEKSMDSTMGFTALDGLVMGTRSGSLDPGVLLYLLQYQHMNSKELEEMLYKKSGLLGVSGISSDMKQLLNDKRKTAKESIELFIFRIRRELGALSAVLGGLDILVFTGGIGERAFQIRERVCKDQAWLNLRINRTLNKINHTLISDAKSRVKVYVIPTNEEWMIANHTYHIVKEKR